MSSIRSIIDEYLKNYHRIQKVKEQIRSIRKQLMKEIMPLESRNKELLPEIIQYMTEHNHDAIRSNDLILRIQPKQEYEKKSTRQQNMENILIKHNMYSPELLQELEPLLTRHKQSSNNDYQLKIK